MHNEYAVEPASLSNWQTFRYLIENLGVSKGRLVSKFPKKWEDQVYKACSAFSAKQRWTLEIKLKRLKKCGLIRSGRPYDIDKGWLENALEQQNNGNPFHAIVSCHSRSGVQHSLVADDLTEEDALWAVDTEMFVPRTVEALGDAARSLLKISDERILFIDKMFNPASKRWQDMLAKFIFLAVQGREIIPMIEYHTKIDDDEYGKDAERRNQDFHAECTYFLSKLLPVGVKLKIVRWDQFPHGDFFHARIILTEKGGIRIDWGLDSGKIGETTLVSLLSDSIWTREWERFKDSAKEFKRVDEVIVEGSLQ